MKSRLRLVLKMRSVQAAADAYGEKYETFRVAAKKEALEKGKIADWEAAVKRGRPRSPKGLCPTCSSKMDRRSRACKVCGAQNRPVGSAECSGPGCDRLVIARGLCGRHYGQLRHHGRLTTAEERRENRVRAQERRNRQRKAAGLLCNAPCSTKGCRQKARPGDICALCRRRETIFGAPDLLTPDQRRSIASASAKKAWATRRKSGLDKASDALRAKLRKAATVRRPFTPAEDRLIMRATKSGKPIPPVAEKLGRTVSSVYARRKRLEDQR